MSKRKHFDALRQNNAPRCMNTLEFPFVNMVRGGLQGGRERETRRVILTAFSWDPGRWPDGGPTEPEEFWVHWDSDQAVQHALAWNDAVRLRIHAHGMELYDAEIWQPLD